MGMQPYTSVHVGKRVVVGERVVGRCIASINIEYKELQHSTSLCVIGRYIVERCILGGCIAVIGIEYHEHRSKPNINREDVDDRRRNLWFVWWWCESPHIVSF
jgi:hypothetical protein